MQIGGRFKFSMDISLSYPLLCAPKDGCIIRPIILQGC
jgi:hypothetical protein